MTTLQIEWAEITMVAITEIKIVGVTEDIKEGADLDLEIVMPEEDPPEVDLAVVTNIVNLVAVVDLADMGVTEVAAKEANINAVEEINILHQPNLEHDTEKILVEDVVDHAVAECALIQFASIIQTFLILKFFS
jgi:hypothetical protein